MTQNAIPVDFGNSDEDGAVRLTTRGTLEHLKVHGLSLTEGLPVELTDGEITAHGRCTNRDGTWVVQVEKWSD